MIIFSPGPANISERVRKAMTLPDISHRDDEFSEILASVRHMLLKVCRASSGNYKSLILCGSGTLAIESVIASLGNYRKKILIVSNGIYGERATEIAKVYGVAINEMRLSWGEMSDLDRLRQTLKDESIGAIYIVHHETTTGLLNPLRDICRIAKERDKMVLVDGISSIAGESLNVSDWGIDALIGSSCKCIGGVPGIAFVVVSNRFIKNAAKCKNRAYYSGLLRHLKSQERKQPLFTPSVQVFYAFREALKELLEEGVESRIKRYKTISKLMRSGLKRIGFKLYLDEKKMSNTMTLVCLPTGYNYNKLHVLAKRKGFVIYSSAGHLYKNTFRIGNVGLISKKDVRNFLKLMGRLCRI